MNILSLQQETKVVPDEEKIYQLALSLTKGINFHLWKKMINQLGSAQAIFEQPTHVLKKYLQLPPTILNSFQHKETVNMAKLLMTGAKQNNVTIHSYFDTSYPDRLRHITKPPCFLYTKGNLKLNSHKIVSIVGTRNATNYGKRAVEELVQGLIDHQVTVISGLAYGIDIHAHQQSLAYGLPTAAVLASGLDIIYPKQHSAIAQQMLKNGGLISEMPLGSSLESFHFPTRNRIIAGLADATIIIEADIKSGAIITANFANDFNREVFAIPGSIHETFSAGCNHLIKTQQAHLITHADDIAYIMNWQKNVPLRVTKKIENKSLLALNTEEKDTVTTLSKLNKEVDLAELSEKMKISTDQLSSIVLQLELKQYITFLPGSKFKLADAI